MINTLDDFINKFTIITHQGWIRTHRSGTTGIGKTLEDLLGIPENNIGEPDFGDYELKSSRINSNSMLTIFTKSPQPKGAINNLRMTFGYPSGAYGNDEKVLHSTLSADRFVEVANTGRSLKISCDNEKIAIIADDNREYAHWTKNNLRQVFERKYRNKLIYVKALSRVVDSLEEFKYIEAYEMSGFNYDSFVSLLEQGKIYIDLRIGQYHSGKNNGKIHDHGTAFRIKENDQPLLFTTQNRIV